VPGRTDTPPIPMLDAAGTTVEPAGPPSPSTGPAYHPSHCSGQGSRRDGWKGPLDQHTSGEGYPHVARAGLGPIRDSRESERRPRGFDVGAHHTGVCCVGGKRTRFSGVLPRSDGVGEFGEDCCEPMSWVDIPAEFVVASSEVLDKRMSGTDHPY
jgi:hypothetical protein